MSMEIFAVIEILVIMKLILTDLMTIILIDIAQYLSGRIAEFKTAISISISSIS